MAEEGEVEKARAMQHRAEAWRSRAGAFASFALGLLYLAGAWFVWKIGWILYGALKP